MFGARSNLASLLPDLRGSWAIARVAQATHNDTASSHVGTATRSAILTEVATFEAQTSIIGRIHFHSLYQLLEPWHNVHLSSSHPTLA